MGNSISTGAGSGASGRGRKAKVMKINGEFFKLSTHTKAGDIIKDYPGHVLIDSDDFLRFNLRSQPLDPQSELRAKKIYLLVQLPKLPVSEEPPQRVLRRTSSDGILSARFPRQENCRQWRRSTSDLRFAGQSPRRRSVKVRLPKAEVKRIVEQSKDDVEAAEKIIDLCMEEGVSAADEGDRAVAAAEGGAGERQRDAPWVRCWEDETTEELSFSKYCINFHSMCSPYITHHRSKYKKLTKDL